MLTHLDQLLRHLIRARVAGIGADDQIGFDPPDDTWVGHVNGLQDRMALNVYLIEMRENRELRSAARTRVATAAGVADLPAPARMDCHYLISAWSPAPPGPQVSPTEEEHRVLYATAVALHEAAPLNPARILGTPSTWPPHYARYYDTDLPADVLPVAGFPKYAEFWGSMGAARRWRPAVYLVVTLPLVPDEPEVFGPPVTTIRTDVADDRVFVIGGRVRTAAGAAVPGAWVALETVGNVRVRRAGADRDGRFRFDALPGGRYVLRYVATGHPTSTSTVDVPSAQGGYDLVFPP